MQPYSKTDVAIHDITVSKVSQTLIAERHRTYLLQSVTGPTCRTQQERQAECRTST